MTERILGPPGKKRRRRLALLAPLVVLVFAVTMLVSASSVLAINPVAGDYQTDNDVQGANDEPNQKDLTMQGTDTSEIAGSGKINVFWNWDDTRVSGNNTMDACALFDSDGDKLANFVLCGILQNIGTPKTFQYKESILYRCGDGRDDRCTQPITVVTVKSLDTTCEVPVKPSPTDPFDENALNGPGDFYPNDTRIFCTVVLADVSVGTTTAVLLNTCSYPSGEPNSDPSDCVVLPGKATPTINTTNVLIPQDSATLSGNATDLTGTSMTFALYKELGTLDNVCADGEKVFQQTDSTPGDGFKTANTGTESVAGLKDGYTVNSNGTYLWLVTFVGNSQNNGATKACGIEQFTVSNLKDS